MAGSKIALIIGGAGNIGSATSAAFAKCEDYKKVIILSRSQVKIDKVIETIAKDDKSCAEKLIGIVGEISDKDGCGQLKDKVVAKVGDKIDTVVSIIGFPYMNCGPMANVTFEQMDSVFRSQFYAGFGAYCSFLPMVQKSDSGSYVFVTGGGPDMYLGPGTGVMTIGGSCNQALARVAMKESKDQENVCCTEMSLFLGVYPNESYAASSPFPWILSSDAGKGLLSVASKRVADATTLVIKSQEDINKVISTGKLENP